MDFIKDKAIEVLSSVLEDWVHGGDADCIIAEFEEKLNNLKSKRNMNQLKVARTIEDARSWAASFPTAEKVETTIQCSHGTAVKIEIIWKGQVIDSIIACRECWVSASDWVRVD